jgi:hypothetical protein
MGEVHPGNADPALAGHRYDDNGYRARWRGRVAITEMTGDCVNRRFAQELNSEHVWPELYVLVLLGPEVERDRR